MSVSTKGSSSPFQKRGIWIESLLLQLERALLREETSVSSGLQEILKDIDVSESKIAQARLNGTLEHDEVDSFVIEKIKCDAATCSNPNHNHK